MKHSFVLALAVSFLAFAAQAGVVASAPDQELFEMLEKTSPAVPLDEPAGHTGRQRRAVQVGDVRCVETKAVTLEPVPAYECGFLKNQASSDSSRRLWEALKVTTVINSAGTDGSFSESRTVGDLVCTHSKAMGAMPEKSKSGGQTSTPGHAKTPMTRNSGATRTPTSGFMESFSCIFHRQTTSVGTRNADEVSKPDLNPNPNHPSRPLFAPSVPEGQGQAGSIEGARRTF